MATTPHMKNENTSSQHTRIFKTHSTQGCSGAEATSQQVTEAHLRQEEAEAWVQPDQNFKYVLVNITTGAAATLCRQHQHEIGLETTPP